MEFCVTCTVYFISAALRTWEDACGRGVCVGL